MRVRYGPRWSRQMKHCVMRSVCRWRRSSAGWKRHGAWRRTWRLLATSVRWPPASARRSCAASRRMLRTDASSCTRFRRRSRDPKVAASTGCRRRTSWRSDGGRLYRGGRWAPILGAVVIVAKRSLALPRRDRVNSIDHVVVVPSDDISKELSIASRHEAFEFLIVHLESSRAVELIVPWPAELLKE